MPEEGKGGGVGRTGIKVEIGSVWGLSSRGGANLVERKSQGSRYGGEFWFLIFRLWTRK